MKPKHTFFAALLLLAASALWSQAPATGDKRPMTFVDVVSIRSVSDSAVSPDGKSLLYTLSVPDWQDGKSYTDVYVVSLDRGVDSTKRMTFTKGKNETSPRWLTRAGVFVFLSNRDAPTATPAQNQLYLMHADGGEAVRLTDGKDGVTAYAISRDGNWLAYTSGPENERQLYSIAGSDIEDAPAATALTRHATGVAEFSFAPDSKTIYFLSPESVDKDDKERRDKKFDVKVRNQEVAANHLWAFDLAKKEERRLTADKAYSVSDIAISEDSHWIGFRGTRQDRYVRTITEASDYSDLYLFNAANGVIERLTNNEDVAESAIKFSSDSRMLAFSASDDFIFFKNGRIYVRNVADAGKPLRKLGADFDGDLAVSFWSKDGQTIYSNSGLKATSAVLAVSIETGKTTPVIQEKASTTASRDELTNTVLINYATPTSPRNLYTVGSLDSLGTRSAWKQLTDANPQIDGFQLGETEAVHWKSSDGKMVEGVLVKPVGYEKGKRYPLIVNIHGGPAGADVLGFHSSNADYANIYAANGYMVLMPNYRGSTNYGERFKMETTDHYFNQGFADIMAGVDYLIAQGMADGSKMGVMGWSAGGHYSNWILTHTDRFKAISTGAGAMNWTSMYAETDVQRIREFYFRGKPYDNFDYLWEISPLKHIKNAKTPTLIHVVDGDPRVPRPQSEELHMALKKLGVATEFFVYPGTTHGIPDARNQVVKMTAEFNWMEKYIKGKSGWFDWKDLLNTIKDDKKPGSNQ